MRKQLHIPKISSLDLRPDKPIVFLDFNWPTFPVKVQQFIEGSKK